RPPLQPINLFHYDGQQPEAKLAVLRTGAETRSGGGEVGMDNMTVKYQGYAKARPPQPIRIETPGWAGPAQQMEDGSEPQPWHCLPFVEGSTYGLELLYQYDSECHVINDNGNIRFDWDYANEPGGALTGGEFRTFDPRHASKFYLFNTRLDIVPP